MMGNILLFLLLAVPFFAWFGSLALAAVTSPLNRTESRKGECPNCSYDLTGLAQPRRCPECGEVEKPILHRRSNPVIAGRTIATLSLTPGVLSLLVLPLFSSRPISEWFVEVLAMLAFIAFGSLIANLSVFAVQPFVRALWIRIPAAFLSGGFVLWGLIDYTSISSSSDYSVLTLFIAPYYSSLFSGVSMLIVIAGFPIVRFIRHLANTWE